MSEEQAKQEASPAADDALLPAGLRDQLLSLLAGRINAGDTLITEAHFQKALEEGYHALTKVFPPNDVKQRLQAVAKEVNSENPEIFVIPGLENWITKSFLAQVRKANWGITELKVQGQNAIRDFVKQKAVRSLISQLQINPAQINVRRCLQTITYEIAGKEDPQKKRAAERLAQVMGGAADAQGGEIAAAPPAGPKVYMLEPAPEPSEDEIEERTEQEKNLRGQLLKEQISLVVKNLDAYVEQGKLTEEDAERLRKLEQVDQAVKSGKVDNDKASKVRNRIMDGTTRYELDKKIKDTVDYAVAYLQVFEALKRIDPQNDNGLRFLIHHKGPVNADSMVREDLIEVIDALLEDMGALKQLISMMDRQDAEVRMMAARLPPYSYVIKRGQDRMENILVEEPFIDDLRNATRNEMSDRLNSSDKKMRARIAVDMLSVIGLINRLIKATPIRKEIRLLKIQLIIEDFYRDTEDLEEARRKAEEFLKTRLRSLYPDLTEEERSEIDQRGADIIDAVEQKIVAERKEQAASEDGEGDVDLSEEEEKKGVQIGRIAIRIAGNERLVPYKIMPDPDGEGKFVMAKKDPESGEMVPVMRRGQKRRVEKNKEGAWELVAG